MPGHGYSIPAQSCKLGAKLRAVPNSICGICYALKGRYVFPNVKAALANRLTKITTPGWVEAMAELISKQEKSGYFRWHDSGDIQDVAHLVNIAKVCLLTPNIKHWLPTREYGIVAAYLKAGNTIPPNLCIRGSALFINSPPPEAMLAHLNIPGSGVCKSGFNCPAPTQDNSCGSCRSCWDKNTTLVNYKVH